MHSNPLTTIHSIPTKIFLLTLSSYSLSPSHTTLLPPSPLLKPPFFHLSHTKDWYMHLTKECLKHLFALELYPVDRIYNLLSLLLILSSFLLLSFLLLSFLLLLFLLLSFLLLSFLLLLFLLLSFLLLLSLLLSFLLLLFLLWLLSFYYISY